MKHDFHAGTKQRWVKGQVVRFEDGDALVVLELPRREELRLLPAEELQQVGLKGGDRFRMRETGAYHDFEKLPPLRTSAATEAALGAWESPLPEPTRGLLPADKQPGKLRGRMWPKAN